MSRNSFGLAFLLIALSAVPTVVGAADELPAFRLRAGEHKAYDRVVFDVPKGTTYRLERAASEVTVSFSKAARFVLRQPDISRARFFKVLSGADGQASLVLQFRVAPDASIKDSMYDQTVIFDIAGAAVKAVPQVKATIQEKKQTAPIPEPKKEKPSAPPPEVKKEDVAPNPMPSSAEKSTIAPAPTPAPLKEVSKGPPLPAPPPKALPPEIVPEKKKALLALAEKETAGPVLTFDPDVRLGAAIFARGGYATILFDRKLSLRSFLKEKNEAIDLESIETPYNSGVRFPVPEGVSVRATRDGTAWEVYLMPEGKSTGISTEFVPQPDFALGARLLLPTTDPPEPFFYTDPVVGDKLLILPLRETSAFTVPRRLADFRIIPSAQGLVIKPWHENIVARIVPDGIEVTSEGGLKLSPPQDTGQFRKAAKTEKGKGGNFFNLLAWRGRQGDTFTETRQKLMQTIIDVPEEQRLLARLDLARFYFAYGLGREASSLLELITKALPETENQTDFVALRGAARILADEIDAGIKDLSRSTLTDQPEATLWLGIGSALKRQWQEAVERFQISFSLLDAYPEPFRSRFMILAVESALASGKDKAAADWIAHLEKDRYDPAYRAAVLYLRGVLYSKEGKYELAERLWKQAADEHDRLYKVRAELALVDLGVATKSLTPKQAIDRLEGLRFAWRGDNLEFDILSRLGGFYIDAHEYRQGLLVFGQALRLYPASPGAPILKAEMKQIFKNIFLSTTSADLSPIEALALYTDFGSLIPEGEEGNKVRANLAERLVDIDLLDQAGNLLQEIIANSTSPKERVLTATRLAGVRLLDHDGKKALLALDESEAEAQDMPKDIQDERRFLRARALSEDGEYDKALAVLPSGESEKAKLLEADIAMRAKHWDDVAVALLSLVGQPPQDGEALSEKKAEWVVNIALALALNGDADGLARLVDAYGPAMERTKKADLFHLIAQPGNGSGLKDLAAAQARLSEVDMFKNFLEGYRAPAKGAKK